MALIDKNIIAMSMPKAMNRGNAIPLDASAVWYTYDEMANYAATDPVAYVGQVLSLVDTENNNEVTAYIIADEAGNLKEVGSATLGDNKTIVLNETTGALGLNNWGKKYYKWIAATDEAEGHYEEVEVDGTNYNWIAGLEPKAVNTGAGFELAWYEPNPSTLEGVEGAIAALQTSVGNITTAIGDAEDAAGTDTLYGAINKVEEDNAANAEAIEALQEEAAKHLPLAGGTMTGDIILPDASKAASEKVVDTKIATAIGSAGHLKRAIVEALPSIEDGDIETIYMMKDPLVTSNDMYEEYMIIEGEWAQIGDTSVDLTNYLQKLDNAVEGNLVSLAADGALVDSGVLAQDVANHITNTEVHITAEERTAWDEGAAQATTNAEAIAALVKISQDDADKLAALPAITEIGNNLVLENGVLSAVAEQYELPAATTETLGGIKIGTGLTIDADGFASILVKTENGLSVTEEGLTLAIATEASAGAMSTDMFVKLNNLPSNAQANVIEGALLGANEIAATIDENKQLLLPFATADLPGLVTSSTADNAIAVNNVTGVMSVNRIATSKLYVPEDDELILNGGSSL